MNSSDTHECGLAKAGRIKAGKDYRIDVAVQLSESNASNGRLGGSVRHVGILSALPTLKSAVDSTGGYYLELLSESEGASQAPSPLW